MEATSNVIALTAVCTKCKVEKPHDLFSRDKSKKTGRLPRCKNCTHETNAAWRKRNIDSVRAKARRAALESKYGISIETIVAMLASQGNRCGICRANMSFPHANTCVDHDHRTGVIRGILCRPCNAGLGQLRDDESVLIAAIAYLRRARGLE